jgi:uncharacterized protein YndB with AHSA1/START domain
MGAEMSDDIRKWIRVSASAAEAFRVYTELPGEWLPPEHTFVNDPEVIAFEPWVGGRFYERSADGTEVTRGTVMDWAPPRRLAVTWRIGPGWRPVFDDEHASVIEVTFTEAGPAATRVEFVYTHLERHGEMAGMLRSAILNPGPGDTLIRYAEAVARHAR